MRLLGLLLALAVAALGQEDFYRIAPSVIPPKALRKVEPHYSPEALAAGVQGIVGLKSSSTRTGWLPTSP